MSEPDPETDQAETETPPVDPDKMLHPNVGHIKDADAQLQQSRDDVDDASDFAKDALDE
jgi:hypothetical protein